MVHKSGNKGYFLTDFSNQNTIAALLTTATFPTIGILFQSTQKILALEEIDHGFTVGQEVKVETYAGTQARMEILSVDVNSGSNIVVETSGRTPQLFLPYRANNASFDVFEVPLEGFVTGVYDKITDDIDSGEFYNVPGGPVVLRARQRPGVSALNRILFLSIGIDEATAEFLQSLSIRFV